MKVTHLSTHDWTGGAARAASRLHTGLRDLGVDSALLIQEGVIRSPAAQRARRPSRLRKVLWDLLQRHCYQTNRTALSATYFSAPIPGGDVLAESAVRAADVLHLHWVTRFVDPSRLAGLARMKPIVWTLHDQRPFTGGCHYSAGCRGYESACAPCPQLRDNPLRLPARVLAAQRAAFSSDRVVVVTPSRWLAECARRSACFADARIEVIPNGVDTAVFIPDDRRAARAALGLPTDGFQILFGADSGKEPRKGAAALAAALRTIAQREGARDSIRLLSFGEPSPLFESTGLPLHHLGYLDGDDELARAYRAADVFVLPSLEDNLPNTMLEALACGTPVAGSNIGGIPELVVDGETGRLFPANDAAAIAAVLLELAERPEDCAQLGAAGARVIRERFQVRHQAERCLALYRSLAPGEAFVPEPPALLPQFGLTLAYRILTGGAWRSEIAT